MLLPPDYQPLRTQLPGGCNDAESIVRAPSQSGWARRGWGLVGYLFALTIALGFTPRSGRPGGHVVRSAWWCSSRWGAAAIPAWAVIDRGNSVGFLAPIALVFLVSLCRQRWGLVTITVALAALLKPPFVLLAVVLFAARQWRWGGLAVGRDGAPQSCYLSAMATGLSEDDPAVDPQPLPIRHFPRSCRSVERLFCAERSYCYRMPSRPPKPGGTYRTASCRSTIADRICDPVFSLLSQCWRWVVASLPSWLALRCWPPPHSSPLRSTTTTWYSSCRSRRSVIQDCPDRTPGRGLRLCSQTHGDRRRVRGHLGKFGGGITIAQIAIPVLLLHIPIFGQLDAKGVVGAADDGLHHGASNADPVARRVRGDHPLLRAKTGSRT